MSSEHLLKEDRPSSRDQLGTQKEKGFCALLFPESTRGFEAQIDDPTDGTFDMATADGQPLLFKGVIAHAMGVAIKMSQGGKRSVPFFSPQGGEYFLGEQVLLAVPQPGLPPFIPSPLFLVGKLGLELD